MSINIFNTYGSHAPCVECWFSNFDDPPSRRCECSPLRVTWTLLSPLPWIARCRRRSAMLAYRHDWLVVADVAGGTDVIGRTAPTWQEGRT